MQPRTACLLVSLAILGASLTGASSASAAGCRAVQIMTSQCTWFALEALKGDRKAMARAQKEATSTLIDGCSPGEYQMVLLRGKGLADRVAGQLRRRGTRDAKAVRAACAAEAGRIAGG